MENYKMTHQGQMDAILETLIKVYAREVLNTNLLLDALEKIGVDRDQLDDEVTHDLIDLNKQIREQIYIDFGYLDPNALK